MSASPDSPLRDLTRRGGVWLVIGAVHAAAVWAFVSGSPIRQAFEAPAIEASLIDLPSTEPETIAPPEVMPTIASISAPVIEPPVVAITEEPAPTAITVAMTDVVKPAPPPAPSPTSAPRVIRDVAYLQPPQPRYPPESKRHGEEGLVVLRVLINELGRAARIEIEKSSGHRRLDEAARAAVERALFRPYIEDGVARMALATIPIEFTWKSRRADKSAPRG